MVQGVKVVVEMVESKLTMDRSAGVESVAWSNDEADARITTAHITGLLTVAVIFVVEVVAGWDTRPCEDVTGAELFEEDEKYFVESTDISDDELGAELLVALLPA